MSEVSTTTTESLTDKLARRGYWPARAARFLAEGKYSQAVEICREYLPESPNVISGRLVNGISLHLTGQTKSAEQQFLYVLSLDPDNVVALKYLADIRFSQGDEIAAMTAYRRILEIDPNNKGLQCELVQKPEKSTRTISLVRGSEEVKPERKTPLRPIPFYTETIGDLYLAQGHPRLAAEVFRNLSGKNSDPRLIEKLMAAEGKIKEKGS